MSTGLEGTVDDTVATLVGLLVLHSNSFFDFSFDCSAESVIAEISFSFRRAG